MNNTRRTFIATLIAALIAILVIPATSLVAAEKGGGGDKADSKKAALQKRFKERYPEIRKLKDAGTIGETDDGELDFVKGRDSDAAKTVEEENADRQALYALIAKDEGTSPQTVARHAAQRNFDKAKSGDFLRTDGKWKKKA